MTRIIRFASGLIVRHFHEMRRVFAGCALMRGTWHIPMNILLLLLCALWRFSVDSVALSRKGFGVCDRVIQNRIVFGQLLCRRRRLA